MSQHCRFKDACLDLFDGVLKMGGDEFSEPYRKQLEEEVAEKFEQFVKVASRGG